MKIRNAIVCDQVRTENTGKHIIIGVYQSDILFNQFPAKTTLAMWLQFMTDELGEYEIEYRITIDGKTMGMAHGKLEILSNDKIQTVLLPQIGLQIDGEGLLVFQIREKKKRWKTLAELQVRKTPG